MTAIINKTSLITQIDSIIAALNLSTDLTEEISLFYKTAINAGASASTIITELTNRIDNASSTSELEELLLLAVSASLITEDRVITVPDLTALNALTNIAAGSVYFVESEYAPYIRKSNSTWVLIDPSLQPAVVQNALSWGPGLFGVKGDNTQLTRSTPTSVVGGFTDWVQVSAGYRYSLGLRANGTLWSWGYASGGKLGDGFAVNRSSPVSVLGGFVDWVQASAGLGTGNLGHGLGLRANGELYAWGSNSSGQLGANLAPTGLGRSSPVIVAGGITNWKQVSAGAGHSLAIRANGELYTWGRGLSGPTFSGGAGRLGDDNAVNRSSPVLVAGGITDWIQTSAGWYSSLALRATGQLYSWGSNANGGLGQNAVLTSTSSPALVAGGLSDWIQVSSGKNVNNHNFALRSNGVLYSWGSDSSGVLGHYPANAPGKSSPTIVIGGITDWVQVETGEAHTLAIRANGVAYGWGNNSTGSLGDNLTTNSSSPVIVAGGFTDWVQLSSGASNNSLGIRAG
jgi:alpha-tubulin suppressor-like RCC1 family protein